MKRVSPRRRQLLATATPWRTQLVCRVGRCEMCGCRRSIFGDELPLAVHEISRGSSREESLDKAFAVLVLCQANPGRESCHDVLHRLGGQDQRALGLALLKRSRPSDSDLESYYRLVDRRFPHIEDVDLWVKRLAFVTER